MQENLYMEILSVSDLNECIKTLLETEELLQDVWVRGEISNFKRHTSGHMYFSLKDETGTVRAVIWKNSRVKLNFALSDGMCIVARGRITVYEQQGIYQLVVSEVKPDGEGALYKAYEELKEKLRQEGLFDESRKVLLPKFPNKIAIITSETAAALHDMITIARRRMPQVGIILIPTMMQGDAAADIVAESLRVADTLDSVDIIILGRGGGSIEDLWTFNTEVVVRAICACNKPVVSAIGHETDFTLSDLAADLRAPTPSAAMEIVLPNKSEILAQLETLKSGMESAVGSLIKDGRKSLEYLMNSPTYKYPERLLQNPAQVLDYVMERLNRAMREEIADGEQRIGKISASLHGLSPLNVMGRGYSFVRRVSDGQIVSKKSDVELGDRMQTFVVDGKLISVVDEVKEGWE